MKIILAIVAVVVLLAMFPLTLLVLSTNTALKVDPAPKVIGYETPLHIHAENSHGVRWITVDVQQDGKSHESRVFQAKEQSFFPKRNVPATDLNVKIGKQTAPELHDGKARVVVAAVSNDFRGKSDSIAFDVDLMTAPPQVVAVASLQSDAEHEAAALHAAWAWPGGERGGRARHGWRGRQITVPCARRLRLLLHWPRPASGALRLSGGAAR